MNMNDQNFGEFLQHKREEKEITLRRMAEMLSVSAPFLSDVEKGRTAPLTKDRLEKVVQILNLSEEERNEIERAIDSIIEWNGKLYKKIYSS